MNEKHQIKRSEKLSFGLRYTRACINLGFYLGQNHISLKQYDRFLWKLMTILNKCQKTL